MIHFYLQIDVFHSMLTSGPVKIKVKKKYLFLFSAVSLFLSLSHWWDFSMSATSSICRRCMPCRYLIFHDGSCSCLTTFLYFCCLKYSLTTRSVLGILVMHQEILPNQPDKAGLKDSKSWQHRSKFCTQPQQMPYPSSQYIQKHLCQVWLESPEVIKGYAPQGG